MAKGKVKKSAKGKMAKARKLGGAGPCFAAEGVAQSKSGKTYTYEICETSESAAKEEGREKAVTEFQATLEQAAKLLVDCKSHKCQGDHQQCRQKDPVTNISRVRGSEKIELAAQQNCEVDGQKKYDYEVRLKGSSKVTCECGAA